jgi:hypothetical protein
VVGTDSIDPGSIARIIKARGAAAGFDPSRLCGHSLRRGAMNTAKQARADELPPRPRIGSQAITLWTVAGARDFGDHSLTRGALITTGMDRGERSA